MVKVAVVLSGCGHLDGAEIRESVISLLALDRAGAKVSLFAPDIDQTTVVNHLSGKEVSEKRNVLVEAARIARGKIKDLKEAKASDFDALVMPGGWGAAKNLSSLAFKGKDAEVIPELKNLIIDFIGQKKPIGVICISPAVLVAAVRNKIKPKVTIGDDSDNLIVALGGEHEECSTDNFSYDQKNNIVSCSAYMRDDPLGKVADGIEKMMKELISLAKK